jgi:hypothetical protein
MPKNTSLTAGPRGRPTQQQPGYIASIYGELRSPENASVIKSVAIFAVAVAFFQSSWSEFIVPG